MDVCRLSAVLAVIFATLCAITSGMSLGSNDLKNTVEMDGSDDGALDEGRRASWLETRELDDDFKNLVLMTLQQLANDGLVNQDLLVQENSVQKRGRWQGFCFRRTKSGRFLPYICWKGDRK